MLAECGADERLTEVRETARLSMHQALLTHWISKFTGCSVPVDRLGCYVPGDEGMWPAPSEWRGGISRAGLCSNPWYGVFDTSWLDTGLTLLDQPTAQEWDALLLALRKSSGEVVRACSTVWKVVSARYAERRRAEERTQRDADRAARRENGSQQERTLNIRNLKREQQLS
jgi:hypothetical protein